MDEYIKKARAAKDSAQLLELAKAEGYAMSQAEADALFAKLHASTGELADEELEAVAGGGCSNGYMSCSIDGHYYRLVDDRSDSCSRLVCRACGGGRGNHRAGCYLLKDDNELRDYCLCCIHCGGHQLTGAYCKLDYKR